MKVDKNKKKFIVKTLVIFFIAAIILTYTSFQIYNSSLPNVKTTMVKSAPLQTKESALARLTYNETVEYKSFGNYKIDQIYVTKGKMIGKDYNIFSLDMLSLQNSYENILNEINALTEKLNLAINSTQKKIAKYNLDNAKNKKDEIETIIKNEGIIKSKIKGEICDINVKKGMTYPKDTIMVTQCDNQKDAVLKWQMSEDAFEEGDKVMTDLTLQKKILVEGKEKIDKEDISVELSISSKRLVVDNNAFEYTSQIKQDENLKLSMSNNQSVNVTVIKLSEPYRVTIPISAVSFKENSKGDIFCAIKNKQNKLISRKIEVDIENYDNSNVAIKNPINDKVIVYTDRPLVNDGVVKE